MSSRFAELCVDSRDPVRLARFWCEVLGFEITEEDEGVVYIEGSEDPFPGITFAKVDDPKKGKNRLHMDLTPSDSDQEDEIRRLLELGARRVDIGQGDVSWVVMADPEGNEFCVLATDRP